MARSLVNAPTPALARAWLTKASTVLAHVPELVGRAVVGGAVVGVGRAVVGGTVERGRVVVGAAPVPVVVDDADVVVIAVVGLVLATVAGADAVVDVVVVGADDAVVDPAG